MENHQPEIEVRICLFRLMARGNRAIAVVRWPLTAVLSAIALAILAATFWEVTEHHQLVQLFYHYQQKTFIIISLFVTNKNKDDDEQNNGAKAT